MDADFNKQDLLEGELFSLYLPPTAERTRRAGGSSPKIARVLTAAVLCVASLASYTAAGIFIADSFRTDVFLPAGIIQREAEKPQVIPAVVVPEETTPSEEKTSDADSPASHGVEGADMSAPDVTSLANETKYDPDMQALLAAPAFASGENGEEVKVLVIHTHATEAYTPQGVTSYSDDTSFRSTDPAENMIAVGDVLCQALEDRGIRTVHCREMFDGESFIHSYEKSAEAVRGYLDEDPGINVVLDVHRDAIFRPDGTLLAPRTADGSAQVMIVCGTDEMGADFPDWEENLAFALRISAAAPTGFMRNINLRGASFNEQLANRFLLVEVGSAGNTLEEAKLAAKRFASAFADAVGSGK